MRSTPRLLAVGAVLVVAMAPGISLEAPAAPPLRFEISFPRTVRSAPIDGRVLLMVSTRADGEPRFQISDGLDTQQIFGADAEGLAPAQPAVIDGTTLGYPRKSLAGLPSGEYYVQGLINTRAGPLHEGEVPVPLRFRPLLGIPGRSQQNGRNIAALGRDGQRRSQRRQKHTPVSPHHARIIARRGQAE